MPNQLWLRIEPEKAINSADAESLQVRVSYEISIQTEDKQNDSHPASDIIRLDRHASAESKLEPVLLSKPIHARLESRQGQELADLGEIDTGPGKKGEPVTLVIPAESLKHALERNNPEQQPVLERSGRFVTLGQVDRRFDDYSLSVDLIDTEAKYQAISSLLAQNADNGTNARSAEVALDTHTAGHLGALSLTGADLKFDGSFHIKRPFNVGTEANGWIWVLNGPKLIVGYQSDGSVYTPLRDLRIMLPWQDPVSDGQEHGKGSCCNNGHPPLNMYEDSLLNDPDLFSDDPGSFCRPFSNPARILGERRFQTVFRVEQPEIESTSNTKPDYRGLIAPRDANEFRMMSTAMVASEQPDSEAASVTRTRFAIDTASLQRFLPKNPGVFMPPIKAIDFLPLPKLPWLNKRQPVSARNPIDWDGDTTKYQALSVAGGHIMEWRVQWRSNGYSLGDVAHTLTLHHGKPAGL